MHALFTDLPAIFSVANALMLKPLPRPLHGGLLLNDDGDQAFSTSRSSTAAG